MHDLDSAQSIDIPIDHARSFYQRTIGEGQDNVAERVGPVLPPRLLEPGCLSTSGA
jgi:hypothetical protein